MSDVVIRAEGLSKRYPIDHQAQGECYTARRDAIVGGFRWCLLGGESRLNLPGLGLSLAAVALSLGPGVSYFRRTERSFADLV